MINRVLIRSKVLQVAYSYYQNDNKNYVHAEKELLFSLEKSYELYHYLLSLSIDITAYAFQRIDMARNKYLPSIEERNPNTRFIDNLFVEQLRNNKALNHYNNEHTVSWSQHESLIKKLYEQICESPVYKDYMTVRENDYETDKELWRKIYKQIFSGNSDLEDALEEKCIYWNDDVDIVLTFVQKTIKRFEQGNTTNQELLPMYKDEEDKHFAIDLFQNTIQNGEKYREIITQSIKNWELERLALMDLLILQIALAEIMEIPGIPLNVSFNEYIDLAKNYSTEKSGLFINGTLDTIVNQLKSENKLFKS